MGPPKTIRDLILDAEAFVRQLKRVQVLQECGDHVAAYDAFKSAECYAINLHLATKDARLCMGLDLRGKGFAIE